MEEGCLAVGLGVDLFNSLYCIGVELVVAGEDGHLRHAVQSRLDLNGGCGAAGTGDGDLLADDVDVVVFEGGHIAEAVSDISLQVAVAVGEGVAGTDKLRCGIHLVQIFVDDGLVGHGNIAAQDFHGAHALHRILKMLCVDFKGEVDYVLTELLIRGIVHCRRV